MAKFQSRRQVTTRKPVIRVNAGLPAGTYRFRLVMVGINGKRSKPTFVNVRIVKKRGRGALEPDMRTGALTSDRQGRMNGGAMRTAKQKITLPGTDKKKATSKKSSKKK